jgi:FkbM family methyltransferase
MIIIDIGACVGAYIDSCLSTYDVEKIYAFEPLRCNYDFMVKKYNDNNRVMLIHAAVSGFNGKTRLYKKSLKGLGIDQVGTEGCSLCRNKQGIIKKVFDEVNVIKISSFIKQNDIRKIDIIKIDAEGAEYDIFQDIFDNGIHDLVGKFCYEDHCRKIKWLSHKRNDFIKRAVALKIVDKIYLEGSNNQYVTKMEIPS